MTTCRSAEGSQSCQARLSVLSASSGAQMRRRSGMRCRHRLLVGDGEWPGVGLRHGRCRHHEQPSPTAPPSHEGLPSRGGRPAALPGGRPAPGSAPDASSGGTTAYVHTPAPASTSTPRTRPVANAFSTFLRAESSSKAWTGSLASISTTNGRLCFGMAQVYRSDTTGAIPPRPWLPAWSAIARAPATSGVLSRHRLGSGKSGSLWGRLAQSRR